MLKYKKKSSDVEIGAFRKRLAYVISMPEFSSNANPNRSVVDASFPDPSSGGLGAWGSLPFMGHLR